jgi:putative flippase GtrA
MNPFFREAFGYATASFLAGACIACAIGAVGLGINAGAIFIAVSYLGLHYLVAKCAAAGFTLTSNFIARRQFLFVQRSTA